MKKKFQQTLGLIAFIAILSLNLNFGKAGDDYDFTSKSIITTAKADMEPGDWQLCNTWCNWRLASYCQLRVYDDWLICPSHYWP